MTELGFAKSLRAGLTDLDTLLVVAPGSILNEKLFPKVFEKSLQQTILALVSDAKPGTGGAVASTLTGGTPRRVVLGALSTQASRHNCPARPDAIQRVVQAAGLRGPTNLIVVVLDDPAHQTAALAAIGRAFPTFSRRSETPPSPKARIQILVLNTKGDELPIDARAIETLSMVRASSQLVDAPPTEMNPAELAKAAKEILRGVRSVAVKEISGAALERQGFRGVLAVGKCAVVPPRVVVATYTPRRATGPHIALVGKGITFDTGGLHLKPRGSMETMKCDMAGAAAVLGAFRVIAKAGVKSKVSLVMALAENAIGPGAYKPDDIITLHSGKTVEINNTDAEGRLLLADAVSYAARILKASIVLDAATLTGAQSIATGINHAAFISNDADLEQLAVTLGRQCGDLVHPLPFAPEFFQQEFRSPVADMRNSVKTRFNAQSSCAGQFIYSHIENTSVRWGHIDLAGPAFRADRATGFGVALLAELVTALSESTGGDGTDDHASVGANKRRVKRPQRSKPTKPSKRSASSRSSKSS
ncbi:MAG: leucyl aminopeptidase family protein [Deltaproteobacteria bacterium]|nr:leucyl aminopeptidase family protein [Deltaproteobacteria bacterium]